MRTSAASEHRLDRLVGRLRVCDAAEAVLREINEPGVMWGDVTLCHMIAERLGWEQEGPRTPRRVLAALARTPGNFRKSLVRMPGDCQARGQAVLTFSLPPNV